MKVMKREEPTMRTNIRVDAKALLNQKNYTLRAKGITDVEIDEIKENITLKIRDETDDHKKE
jgi:hypothetical protein